MGLKDLKASNLQEIETSRGIAWTMNVRDTEHDFEFEVTNRGTGGPNEYNPISIHMEVRKGNTVETSVGPTFDINFREYLGGLKKEAEQIFEINGICKIEALDTIMAHWEPGRKISHAVGDSVKTARDNQEQDTEGSD
tara:strand:- start:529 stop:942 length:414 start_codon:yes stop_codon:yes gene_type:complete